MNVDLHMGMDSILAFKTQHDADEPSLNALGLLAEWGGISGLSLSSREDWQETALTTVKRWSDELNLKVSLRVTPDADLRRLSFELKLDRVTLIPPRWVGPTVIGGLDAYHLSENLRATISQLREADIEVAAQVEPKAELIKRLQRLDVDTVIFSTHALTSSSAGDARRAHFSQLMDAAVLANRFGLRVAVNGGINLSAAEQLCRIAQVSEIHVDQSLSARALLRGLDQATADFLKAMEKGRQNLL